MDINNWNIENNQLEVLRNLYKNLYEKSRETMLSTQQQDIILDKLTDDIFLERLSKLMNEDVNISKEKSISIYAELKELMAIWKKEFDLGRLT